MKNVLTLKKESHICSGTSPSPWHHGWPVGHHDVKITLLGPLLSAQAVTSSNLVLPTALQAQQPSGVVPAAGLGYAVVSLSSAVPAPSASFPAALRVTSDSSAASPGKADLCP